MRRKLILFIILLALPPLIGTIWFVTWRVTQYQLKKQVQESAEDVLSLYLITREAYGYGATLPIYKILKPEDVQGRPMTIRQMDQEYYDQILAQVAAIEDLDKRRVLPPDLFARTGAAGRYRYGVSPRKIVRAKLSVYFPDFYYNEPSDFIIAGNGPDGIADVDVTRFDANVSTTTKKARPDLGLGRNPVDLIYDPTNGLSSRGDIFLIFPVLPPLPGGYLRSHSSADPAKTGPAIGPKALWDVNDFKKRYGL